VVEGLKTSLDNYAYQGLRRGDAQGFDRPEAKKWRILKLIAKEVRGTVPA
jgi:hypothetical protein